MSAQPPTITEVAEAAGVAVSTVSRVLNGGSASSAAQEKVARAVERLGFRPSLAARNLKLGRTGIVGIAGASTRAPWFGCLLEGMQSVLTQQSASLAICSLEREGAFDPAPVRAWIENRRIDSLVFVRPGRRERPLISAAWKAGIPVVCAVPDAPVKRGLVILGENRQGGRLAAEHLLSLGHERIAFFGGPSDSIDSHDRLTGLRERCAEDGIAIEDEFVCFGESYDVSAGQLLAKEWIQMVEDHPASRRTAAVLGNDGLALGFMRTIHSHGLRIPDDVSVVGFDGIPEGEFSFPALTTIAQPIEAMGAEIAAHVLRPLDDIRAEGRIARHYAPELIVRESSARPRQCGPTLGLRP